MSSGQVGQEGPGLTKDPPETSVGTAAAGQVGVEERIRLEAQQRDLISSLALQLPFHLSLYCLRSWCASNEIFSYLPEADILHYVQTDNHNQFKNQLSRKLYLYTCRVRLPLPLVEINHASSLGLCRKAFWEMSALTNLLLTQMQSE